MPIRIIQWYLETVHQLHLSVGAIVQAVHGVARQAERRCERCSSKSAPVGAGRRNRLAPGMFGPSALPANDFLRRGREGVVDEVLDSSFSGVWSVISTPPITTTRA